MLQVVVSFLFFLGAPGDLARGQGRQNRLEAEFMVMASADGKPQGGHTADFGNGELGTAEATAREVTP